MITADGGLRRGGAALMKPAVDEAVADAPSVEHVIVFERLGADVPMQGGRDHLVGAARAGHRGGAGRGRM